MHHSIEEKKVLNIQHEKRIAENTALDSTLTY